MNPDLETLIEELKQIKENDSQFKLTHSEIISFLRAFIAAIEDSTIFLNPFSEFTYDEKNKVIFHLNLIRAYGINHVTRSRMAAKVISIIEEVESKKKLWLPRMMMMAGIQYPFNNEHIPTIINF